MPVGNQDPWIVGARFYFKRDNIGANQQPWIDLGVIQQVTPQISNESVQLEDADGGLKKLVDERITKISEAFDLQCSNMSLENLALLFMSNPPADFTQAQAEKTVSIRAFPGRLLKVHDSDAAKTLLYKLDAFGGIYTGTVLTKTLTTIVAATKTITLSGDQMAVAGLAAGKKFIANKLGLTNIANSQTYTIVSRTLNGGNTDFVVAESPASDESAITGQVTHENAGTVYGQATDFEVVSLDRGLVRLKAGGGITTEQDVTCVFTVGAVSGKRLLNPQSLSGQIKGDAMLILGRGNNAEQTAREGRVAISSNGANFSADEFSNLTLTVKLLSDPTATVPAGRMLTFKGDLPSLS